MDAQGKIRKYSKTENLNDDFYAVVVNLGCMGIILSIKMQCEKAFNLEQIEYPAKLEHVCIMSFLLQKCNLIIIVIKLIQKDAAIA
jgi:hypothetical protein